MKNILLIGSELGKGGAERSISLLSFYLQEYYNVTLCILSGTDRQKYYKTCNDVVFIDPPNYTNTVGKIKAWRHRIQKLKQLKKDKNIEVSISFLEGPDYLNVITANKEKIILSVRGSKMHDGLIRGLQGSARKKILIPWLYNKADKIVTVTDALKKELTNYFSINEQKIQTIYNFYETDIILKKSSESLTSQEEKIFSKPVIISSGRLHVQKEFDKLIRVYAGLKKNTDARLMILGDGALLKELLEAAEQQGLRTCVWKEMEDFTDADVYFMGFQENAFKFYHRSKLFALTSSWEGFPNVMAEALICNIPVIATDCYTGPREILNISDLSDESVKLAKNTPVGALLPLLTNAEEDTINLWSATMHYWLQHPKPSSHAFEKLTQRFTLQAMLHQWKQVIDN